MFARFITLMVISALGAGIAVLLGATPTLGSWALLFGWMLNDEGMLS